MSYDVYSARKSGKKAVFKKNNKTIVKNTVGTPLSQTKKDKIKYAIEGKKKKRKFKVRGIKRKIVNSSLRINEREVDKQFYVPKVEKKKVNLMRGR